MQRRQDGVKNQHARPGVAHDLLELFEHGRVEALGGAKTACRLVPLLVRARIDAVHGVMKQMLATFADLHPCVAMPAAVNSYHVLDRFLFPLDPGSAVWQDEIPQITPQGLAAAKPPAAPARWIFISLISGGTLK